MKHKFTLSITLSLLSCVAILGFLMRHASGSTPIRGETAAEYRYRTSQAAHWRAITMVHQN